METRSKRILAIVLIVVVGVAIGFTVWFFLVQPYGWSAADAPGAPPGTPSDRIIKMGVLGGLTDIQGDGQIKGARLAAREINEAGGIDVNGVTYYIGITAEDTDESNPNLDITKGVAAAQRIIDFKQCQFLTGGFRTEALLAYQEVIMDAQIPFIGTGASTDIFCENVLTNYARYKYFFRNMPINSTSLAIEILTFIATYQNYFNLTNPENIYKVGLLYEDLTWTDGMIAFFNAYLPLYGMSIVSQIAYPTTVTQTQMDTHMNTLDTAGVQMLIPVISAQGGILMMNSYATVKPGFVVLGIDVQSQLDTYWAQSTGNCKYETVLQSLFRTNKTDVSIPFWDAYLAAYSQEPIYTAVGSYDAINMFAWAINQSQSFNPDTIIDTLETITIHNPRPGAGGLGAFTTSHDVREGYPFGFTLFVQWQEEAGLTGNPDKQVIPTFGQVYPDSIATAPYLLPGADGDTDWAGWSFNA